MNIDKKLGMVILVLTFIFGATAGVALVGMDRHEEDGYGRKMEGNNFRYRGDFQYPGDIYNMQDPTGTPNTPTSPSPQVNYANPGEHCGGNMTTALACSTGYHCAPTPGSNLPFGDVGGTCVKN